jgi:hypothetical protein
MIASLTVCALLSLTFTTAAALACPGGGGGGGESVAMLPEIDTFSGVGDRRKFTFFYVRGSATYEVGYSIVRPEKFRIIEAGRGEECVTRVRRLSPREICTVWVEAVRAGQEGNLLVELVGTSPLVAAVSFFRS